MPNIGPVELIIILVIALLILGPGKLPDVGAAVGKSIREFRKATQDVQDTVTNATTMPAPGTQPTAPAAPVAVTAPAPAPAPAPVVEPVAAPAASAPAAPAATVPAAPAETTAVATPTEPVAGQPQV